MSQAKKELEALEAVCSALAHAARRQILLTLKFRGGKMTAGDIAQRFSCRWPTISRHLRALEEAGLLRVQKLGRERMYELQPGRIHEVLGRWLKWFE